MTRRSSTAVELSEVEQRIDRVNGQLRGFRGRLDVLLREGGLTPAQLARLSGADPGAVSRYLSLNRLPSSKSLALMCDLLDCTTDYLLIGRE